MSYTTGETIQYVGLEKLQLFGSSLPKIVTDTCKETWNTKGRAMYKEINDRTPVRTGRLKRGNWMEITDTSMHYWNNVPYAYHVDAGTSWFRGRKYMTEPFEKHKPIILAFLSAKLSIEIGNFFRGGT